MSDEKLTDTLELSGSEVSDISAITGLAYSGDPISVGLLYPVVFDLSGLKASPQVPLLYNHINDPSYRLGVVNVAISEAGVSVTGGIDKSARGASWIIEGGKKIPWQLSVGVHDIKFEKLTEGKTATVNGRDVTGPMYIARQSVLREVSIVAVGADPATTLQIAAMLALHESAPNLLPPIESRNPTQEENTMAEEIKSQVDNEAMTAAAVQAERARVTAVRDICAGEHNNIEAAAIADGSTPDQVRAKVLDAIRAKRMTPPAPPKSEISPGAVLAAAISQACGVSEQENIKANGETALAAADKAYRGNLGLQGTIIEAAKAHGWSPSGGNRLDASNWFEAVQAACSVQAGYSEVALPNILGGVINRRLLEGWGTVDQSWRQISDVATVNDFKAISSYRLIKGGGFQKVSETGELKHGSLSEAGFSNRADTYGEMLTLTRKDIINDDLNALARVPFLLGQEAALAFNVLFWTEFLNDAAFFSSGNGNLQSSTALSVEGLTSGVKKFRSLKDEAGHFLGSAPAVILVAPGNEVLAEQLFKDTAIVAVGIGSSKALSPASNPHAGKYKPVCSPYLADTSISGYSDTSWYLLSSPAFRAAIQAVFLGGRQTPYVQSAETAFNTLGIQHRAYMDWGVAKQDHRAGVKFTA